MKNGEKKYHLDFGAEHGAKYAILPGDPGRVEKIAALLENPSFFHQNREYLAWTGFLEGEKILVMSTGMGGPSAAIAAEELIETGVTHLLRVGTCGGMQEQVCPGDLVIAQSAIRQEGTSREYLPVEMPAAADFEFCLALRKAADRLGLRQHIGTVQCKDSFYGQHAPESMPISYELEQKWRAYIKAGCLASEMESAALYAVASVRRVRAACILHVIWNQERERLGYRDEPDHNSERAIRCGIEALRLMIRGEVN